MKIVLKNHSSLIKKIFLTFSRFGAFETFKTKMMDKNGQLSTSGKLLAGLGAGVCEAIIAVTVINQLFCYKKKTII